MTNLTASDLYAQSCGYSNNGDQECYWCGSKCQRRVLHNQRHPDIGKKLLIPCKRPANQYICQGCWLYQRKSITVFYPNGSLRDRQQPDKHSWWITADKLYSVLFQTSFYPFLLNPPLRFVLALVHPKDICPNYLQCMVANDHIQVRPTTELFFTLNNRLMTYTVYELEEALCNGVDGKAGGARELVNLFGPYKLPNRKENPIKKRGKQPFNKETDTHPGKKIISSFLSGAAFALTT